VWPTKKTQLVLNFLSASAKAGTFILAQQLAKNKMAEEE
jgi:hypothetical protein